MGIISKAKNKYRREGLVPLFKSGTQYMMSNVETDPVALRNLFEVSVLGNSVVRSGGVCLNIDTPKFDDNMKKQAIHNNFGPSTEAVDKIAGSIAATEADLIEIGAGIGYMSCQINRRMDSDKTHVAVEANELLIPVIEEVKKLNDCTFNIENKAYAVDEAEIELKLYENYIDSTVKPGRGTPIETVSVPTTTVGELREAYDLSEFVLYTNMEGSEYDLIDEEIDLIRNHCPLIIIGFHDIDRQDAEIQEYIDLMAEEFVEEWHTGRVPGTRIYRNPRF
jgi:FkbM family methyltransferase